MKNKFDITVLVPIAVGAKEEETLDGIKVIRYHYFPIHKWETLCYPGAIVPRIKEKKSRILLVPFLLFSLFIHLYKLLPEFDLVHAHWLIPQGIIQSFFKTPYIVTGHGGDVTSFNKGILKMLKKRCLKEAKYVTVVSKHLEDKIKEIYQIDKMQIIPMGCNIQKFGKRYYQENYFGQEDKKVILFVGRLAEKKGVRYLIEAMKEIDALLIIVGDGPLRLELVQQAENMKEKVIFLGAKTHEELKTIYASADIFVAPSITAKDGDQEGLPTTILEALASEMIVIASDTGGIREVIRHGYNGYLCHEKCIEELKKAIINAINKKELLKKNILKSVKGYSYDTISKKYIELLRRIT